MLVFFNGKTPDMECDEVTLRQGENGIEIVLRNERKVVLGVYDFAIVKSIVDKEGVTHKLKLIP